MQLVKSLENNNPQLYKALRVVYKRLQHVKDQYVDGIRTYMPKELKSFHNLPTRNFSAWKGLELIIGDVISQSEIKCESCLEFGVEYGYSTAVFANYFDKVTGVDLFTGDLHAGFKGNVFEVASANLKDFKNITLIKNDYKDFIKDHDLTYDLIHVDIIHTYEDTYECGLWAAEHSNCTLFHDTESFSSVKKAVRNIAKKTGKRFYNYPYYNGLGILF
ncbi:MAG: class I SAM-dependent methyltransferase [Bacteroidota bacterium]|nr:class I SAM-dependent methyltransferase [Bacteroidota bacterium]